MACAKVSLEDLPKARQTLSRASLAPGTPETLRELQARQRLLTEQIPAEVSVFQPGDMIDIAFENFVMALKAAARRHDKRASEGRLG